MPNENNVAAFRELLIARVSSGLERMAGEMATQSQQLAPVGHERAKAAGIRSAEPVSLKPITASKMFPKGATRQRFVELHGLNGTKLRDVVRASDVGFFRFSGGVRKGQTPEGLDVSGRSVRGFKAKEHGRLRRGIHAFGPVIEGNRVIAGVRSDAPYSYFVEHGFTHAGGKQIEQRPFLRAPLKQRQGQGAAALARYIRESD